MTRPARRLSLFSAALLGCASLVTDASAVVTNVALVGTASQSSTRSGPAYQGDIAQVALDGNTSGVFNIGSVTHTNTQTAPWWEVDLKTDRAIDDIIVWNRTDGTLESRLNGFQLSVLDAARTTVFSTNPATPNPDQTIDAGGVTGRYVRIDLPGASKVLSLAEVQVFSDIADNDQLFFGNGRNLATLGAATQSTTREGAPKGNQPILAIDGNTNGAFSGLSVTHTVDEPMPSWTVELQDAYFIDHVKVFERTDGCCDDRLQDFNVSVLDAGMNVVWSQDVASVNGNINLGVAGGVKGKFVKIEMNDNGTSRSLELAEVEVYGGELVNLARRGTASASQSSTRTGSGGNAAEFAVDGNTDGAFGNGSVTHTLNQPNSFWEVDLGTRTFIDEITLFNRTDCCEGRLSNFRVSVFHGGTEVWGEDYFATGFVDPSMPFRIQFDEWVEGDRVRIALNGQNNDGNGVLSLAEVQVFGVFVPEPTTAAFGMLGLAGLAMRRRKRSAS